MNRRSLLWMLGVGAGVAVARPAPADRIRILPEVTAGEPAAGGERVAAVVRRFLEGVRVGERRAYGGLTVFWLHASGAATGFAIRTLDEARARGELLVTERDQATVSGLVIENRGPVHVLVLAGEILLGGKQNRIVVEDVLVPPWSGPLTLPVHCVEQGRWAGPAKQLTTRDTLAAPKLRARMLDQSDQQQVWAEVQNYARRAAAPSATGSYQAIHDKPEVKAHQHDVEAGLGATIAPGARGAAVFVGDTLAGLDLFQDGSLFAREWPKLLRAGTIEAYGRKVDDATGERQLRAHVDDLVKSAAGAPGSVRRGVGAGWLVELRPSRAKGSALVAEAQVVHVALL
ncbi:MAG: ARPP-1 family domain-containing protein [Candidatus Rokuibacteriota bacterium]